MESEETSNKCFRVSFDVVVVVFEYCPEEFVLFVSDGFEHVLAVSGVVEEGAGLALAGKRGHGVDFAKHQRGHQSIRSDAHNVILIVDVERFADMVESVWGVVCE